MVQLLEQARTAVTEGFHNYQMGKELQRAANWNKRREELLLNPSYGIEYDLKRIYKEENFQVGWPEGMGRIYDHLAENNVYAITGAQLGDEGKGRVVDNVIQTLKEKLGAKPIYVTRFQGGSNAGHTVEAGGKKIALHQVPSIPFEQQAVGIMDSMMTVNIDELRLEYNLVEDTVGPDAMKNRLILSKDAILNTDLDRATEALNKIKASGKGSGSTARGIGPSVADYYDRVGLQIKDLLAENWKEVLGKKYDDLALDFQSRGHSLEDVDVPDYEAVIAKAPVKTRKVGSKAEFLERLEQSREWLEKKEIAKNTFPIQLEVLQKVARGEAGVIFEGAQAVGLHPWLGTVKDVTSTNSANDGILLSTKVWDIGKVKYRIGIFKATYMSSVGIRRTPTRVDLGEKVFSPADLPAGANEDQQWAAWIRDVAHEYGTTTGRPRDICHLDIPMLSFHAHAGNIEMLAATHLDIAQKDKKIKVCTHYLHKDTHEVIPYQPGLEYQQHAEAQYVELPGWDPDAVSNAKSFDDVPKEAKQFLAFIQARTGVPIVMATTGPERQQIVEFPQARKETLITKGIDFLRREHREPRNYRGDIIYTRN